MFLSRSYFIFKYAQLGLKLTDVKEFSYLFQKEKKLLAIKYHRKTTTLAVQYSSNGEHTFQTILRIV